MNKQNRVLWIEGIRGILCCLVMATHIWATDTEYGVYASGCGKIAVWGFMVLSGYFAMSPYTVSSEAVDVRTILSYYKKRVFQIIPPYFCVLLFAYFVGMLSSWKSVCLHLVTVVGIGHFWYMSVMLRFYAVFPVFIILRKLIKSKRLYVLTLLLILVCVAVAFPFTVYEENSVHLYWYLPVFLMGMLLSFAVNVREEKIGNICWDVAIFILTCLVICMTPPLRKMIWGIESGGWLQNKYIYFGVIWVAMISFLWRSRYIQRWLKKNMLLRFLGKISLEIYLLHFPILLEFGVKIQNMILRCVFTVGVSIFAAYVLNLAIQKMRYGLVCYYKKNIRRKP